MIHGGEEDLETSAVGPVDVRQRVHQDLREYDFLVPEAAGERGEGLLRADLRQRLRGSLGRADRAAAERFGERGHRAVPDEDQVPQRLSPRRLVEGVDEP